MSKPIDYSKNPSLIQERSGGQIEGWWSPSVREATVTGGFPEPDRAISAKSRTGAVELRPKRYRSAPDPLGMPIESAGSGGEFIITRDSVSISTSTEASTGL